MARIGFWMSRSRNGCVRASLSPLSLSRQLARAGSGGLQQSWLMSSNSAAVGCRKRGLGVAIGPRKAPQIPGSEKGDSVPT